MPKIKRVDLIWAAGLFDGEGCISLSKRSPQRLNRAVSHNYTLVMKIAMCHRATVLRFQRLFGVGTIHTQRLQHSHFSPAWIWFCNRSNAKLVIQKLRPWLFTKAKEADLALEFFSLPPMQKGGRWGSRPVTPQLERQRNSIFIKLRNCKTRNVAMARRKKSESQVSGH